MSKLIYDEMKIVDEEKINKLMSVQAGKSEIKEILKKAEEKKSLTLEECAKLLSINDSKSSALLFKSAKK